MSQVFYEDAYEASRRAIFANIIQPEPAAIVPPVPAVHLDREEWESLKSMVKMLRELKQSVSPRPMETALIQGSLIAEIVEAAERVRLPE